MLARSTGADRGTDVIGESDHCQGKPAITVESVRNFFSAPSGRGIAVRLLVSVLLFSSAVTLTLTALELYLDYKRDVAAIDVRLDEIQRGYVQNGIAKRRTDMRPLSSPSTMPSPKTGGSAEALLFRRCTIHQGPAWQGTWKAALRTSAPNATPACGSRHIRTAAHHPWSAV